MALCVAIIFAVWINKVIGQFDYLWPLPQHYTNGSETVTICSFNFSLQTNTQSSAKLNNAISRFTEYLLSAPEMLKTRQISNIKPMNEAYLCSAVITSNNFDETLSLDTNESYTLFINTSNIIISSETIYGAMYALTTLKQLIRYDPINTQSNIITNIPWQINDYPIFKHRGVMLDSSRNFLSIDTLKQVFDGMALNKLNVFHWHIIDAQSFPFYSKSHPELTTFGAYSQKEIYYPSNITDLVNYAANLGIRVIPEFDAPGHTMIIWFGSPDIMECVAVSDNYPAMCPQPPCGYLNVQKPSSYLTMLEVMSDAYELFNDSYFHIGADEVNAECWGENTTQLYNEWIETMCSDVHNNGNKVPVLWSGHLNIEADIGQNEFDIIIQIWDDENSKLIALQNGFKIIDSIYDSYYLDCGFGNPLMGWNGFWCDPIKNWITIYNHSLTHNIPNQYFKHILGGEVCLWGESVDANNLFAKLWPRASAAAERWWNNNELSDTQEINTVFHRLAIQRDFMVKNGISSSPLHPQFCTLYPEYCEFYRNSIWNPVNPATEAPKTTESTQIIDVSPTGVDGHIKTKGDNGFGSAAAIIMFFIGMLCGLIIAGVVYMVLRGRNKKQQSASFTSITDGQL